MTPEQRQRHYAANAAPLAAQRVTSAPTAEVVTTAPQLPATGRRTWAQVRLSIALALAGIGCLAVAKVWEQDEELEAEDGR